MEIKVLSQQGQSIRQIARLCGVSRQTVRRYLTESTAATPLYKARPPKGGVLDEFKPYIVQRLEQALPDRLAGSVLLRELKERGYVGGRSTLNHWLTEQRPVLRADPVVRFETEPGQQMQADFTWIRKKGMPLLAFVATLGHCRASYVHFTRSEDADTLIRCLQLALEYFGGVPQHILFDNPKTIVITRDAYGLGLHQFNPKLLAFAQDMGFVPRLCRPYRARTKGKVERFNGYLKTNFIVPLRATIHASGLQLDDIICNGHIGKWLQETANARVHAGTKLIPSEQWVLEQPYLQRLPVLCRLPNPAASTPLLDDMALRWALPSTPPQHDLAVYETLLAQEWV